MRLYSAPVTVTKHSHPYTWTLPIVTGRFLLFSRMHASYFLRGSFSPPTQTGKTARQGGPAQLPTSSPSSPPVQRPHPSLHPFHLQADPAQPLCLAPQPLSRYYCSPPSYTVELMASHTHREDPRPANRWIANLNLGYPVLLWSPIKQVSL